MGVGRRIRGDKWEELADENPIAPVSLPSTCRYPARLRLHPLGCGRSGRRIGLRRDLECGDLHFARVLRFCSCSRKDRRWPCTFRGPKLSIERGCQRQWGDPGERCRRWTICVGLRQIIAQFRRGPMGVLSGRMLRQLVSLATRKLLLRTPYGKMKKLALVSALLLAASPAAAQVATSLSQQQLGGQSVEAPATQAPTAGVFCIEEMTATFCNVPSGPSEGGYGSRSVSTSTSGAGSSGVSASSGGAGGISSSIPPCGSEPPFNEQCN